jgi:ankyrin repeat protein
MASGRSSALQSIVEIEIQPLLHNYFKLNDWQKMNGDISVKVAKIIPIAWPVALGSGGETLEDPDETPLMRAAVQGDLKTVRQLLSETTSAGVNALDQGGQSALILACQNPKTSPDVVKALIAAGANVTCVAGMAIQPLPGPSPEITTMSADYCAAPAADLSRAVNSPFLGCLTHQSWPRAVALPRSRN